jgi:hypothetical protein
MARGNRSLQHGISALVLNLLELAAQDLACRALGNGFDKRNLAQLLAWRDIALDKRRHVLGRYAHLEISSHITHGADIGNERTVVEYVLEFSRCELVFDEPPHSVRNVHRADLANFGLHTNISVLTTPHALGASVLAFHSRGGSQQRESLGEPSFGPFSYARGVRREFSHNKFSVMCEELRTEQERRRQRPSSSWMRRHPAISLKSILSRMTRTSTIDSTT